MARLARSTAIGFPHHVIQRGHCDQLVFDSDADYLRYIDWAREYGERFGLDTWAYCLMPNHVHFICVPKAEGALARACNSLHMRYAQYFNAKRGVAGPLWRPRFMSCILDEPSVNEEIRFVESNPVRAGLAARAEDYRWSSARGHVTGEPDPLLSDHGTLRSAWPDWRSYLAGGANEALIRRVRERLRTGRPAGDPEFVGRLEEMLGRRLQARPRGRPRKTFAPEPTTKERP